MSAPPSDSSVTEPDTHSAVSPAPTPAPRKLTPAQRALVAVAGTIMRVWCASLRIQPTAETRRLFASELQPTLFVLWHNRLFAAAEFSRQLRPTRPLHCLVSASKDGAWLSAFFESVGLRVVRGSSSRGGREAAAALVEVLRAGHDAGITPDGPRGPIYGFKPGALVVARRARAQVVLIGVHYANAWTLRSWDRFLLPHPFSTVRIHTEAVPREIFDDEDARGWLETRMLAINGEPTRSRAQNAGTPFNVV